MDMRTKLNVVFLVNGVALVILFYTALCTIFMFKDKKNDKALSLLKSLLLITLILTIVDTTSYVFDAKYGLFKANTFTDLTVTISCSLIRIGILAGLACFDLFIVAHLTNKINKVRIGIINGIIAFGILCLIINFFYPFVFEVNNSVYKRVDLGFYLFTAISGIIFIDILGSYIYIRKKGGMLKFFPIWLFLLPIVIAIIVQAIYPDISTLCLGVALSFNAIILALQNETIFRDRLTKLYNRMFLDILKNIMEKSSKAKNFTAMMLDLNGFKLINDNFGHQVGDEALIVTGSLLREAVGAYGAVIRFAGDEFIIILNTQNDDLINKLVKNINDVFDSFNKAKKVQYELSISLGYSKVDLRNNSVDDILKEIDEKMYLDKQEKHKAHPEWDRK